MTAPLFFVEVAQLKDRERGAAVRLAGPAGRHASRVRRLGVGERVLLADGAGRGAEAVVRSVLGDELDLELTATRSVPEPSPRFVLVQALAKGDRDELAAEAATELGVDEVVPWQAARSVVQWRGQRAERSRRRWESVVRSAAQQSRRLRVPRVTDVVTTAELARRLSGDAGNGDRTDTPTDTDKCLALVLHEEAEQALAAVELPDDGDVLVVVGPEGGIGGEEMALLRSAGGVAVRLGDGVLRSSTAGPAALAVLSAGRRWR